MSERVTTTLDGAVAHVQLSRPEKRNGLDRAMAQAHIAAGEGLKGEPGLRAVVLSGQGAAFCAGLDFQSFLAGGAEVMAWFLGDRVGPANNAQRCGWVWQELEVPVIAAVQGVAFGGGLQIALGADIRLVTPDVRLSVMEIEYGMIPDMGISRSLLRQVRPDVAKELLFTGREVGGQEAVSLGLATRVCEDPLSEALTLARAIAARNPEAVPFRPYLGFGFGGVINRFSNLDDMGELFLVGTAGFQRQFSEQISFFLQANAATFAMGREELHYTTTVTYTDLTAGLSFFFDVVPADVRAQHAAQQAEQRRRR